MFVGVNLSSDAVTVIFKDDLELPQYCYILLFCVICVQFFCSLALRLFLTVSGCFRYAHRVIYASKSFYN